MHFHAKDGDWFETSPHIHHTTPVPDDPLVVARWQNVYSNITIPAGSLHAEGSFRIGGDDFFIEQGYGPGAVEPTTGQFMGDFKIYRPGVPMDTGQYWIWDHFDAIGDSWKLYMHPTAIHGDYRFKVDLATPYPTDSVWQVEGMHWFFNDHLAAYGFQRPFVDWVH